MAKEIERKFLVDCSGNNLPWHAHRGVEMRQGYLSVDKHRTVRVRIAGDSAWLTVKGLTENAARDEFEYEIPPDDARQMLELCDRPLIEKIRYEVPYEGRIWEVDEFSGSNQGLIIAEVELNSIDAEVILPQWVGKEVTEDARYYNANLSHTPFSKWM